MTPSPAGTNWVINNGISRIAGAASPAERIGNVCYIMRVLRNALMHEVNPLLDLYLSRKIAGGSHGFSYFRPQNCEAFRR